MPPEHPLSAIFVPALRDPARDALPAQPVLESILVHIFSAAQGAWPEFSVRAEAFFPYFADRVSREGPDALQKLRASDLYVACACVMGDPRAMGALETRYFPEIEGALAKMNLGGARVDDVKQGLRRQMFVGEDGVPPRIAEYTGRGDLRGWLRVTAVRAALKLIRKEKREVLVEDEQLFVASTSAADPELLYVKEVYRAEFKIAFQEALESLEDREKNLLRQHVVDALSIDEIGALYQVHRATAARWLGKAKETLLSRTRQRFMARAKINGDECDSIMRLVHSQLDMTIRRRLEDA
jgi:RNA polymerase sigma-70 factor, ECF subfamily